MSAAAKRAGIDPIAVARRAQGPWHALRVSMLELRALATFALAAMAAIEEVAALAEDAEVHDTAVGGSDVIHVLTRHGLYSDELYHHNITERRNG
jgi:hypothetical protein